MKIRPVLLTCLLLLATLGSLAFVNSVPVFNFAHATSQIIVNFDKYPNGTNVPSMTVINNQYAAWAVTFTPFRVYNLSELEPTFASQTSNYSQPNVGGITRSDSFAPYNFINFTARFSASNGTDLFTDFVSVKVGDTNIGSLGGNLTAYDQNNQKIGFAQYLTTDLNFHTLAISRPTPDIAYVTFWTDSDGCAVDDFTFNVAVVPEFPTGISMILLLAITVSAFIYLRRRIGKPNQQPKNGFP